ncbi:MAG TPA: HAD-IA family hydrolase [Acidimicrobiales bacterium]|nr:HAD-IA family hydrolase [Acidimicrobiales bacterium]
MGEVRAVLWDFGGVILSSPFEAFARYERERGLPEGFLRQLNATNPDTNAWAKLERSEVDLAGFAELYEAEADAAGHRVEAGAVLALLSGELRPAMVQALRRIREEGLAQACLTNNVAGTEAVRPELAEVMALFDTVLESSKLGVRKPDPRFYDLALEAVGVAPSEAVFLDDLGVNLKPARALGIRTIKVVDPTEALAELQGVLGFDLNENFRR